MIIFEKVKPGILQCIGHLDLAKGVWINPGKMCPETKLEDFDAAVAEIERLSLDTIHGPWNPAEMVCNVREAARTFGR